MSEVTYITSLSLEEGQGRNKFDPFFAPPTALALMTTDYGFVMDDSTRVGARAAVIDGLVTCER